jgi:hypothetical protein
MIRKVCNIALLLALFSAHTYGQQSGIITPDSLLSLFKTRSPFDILLNSRVYGLTDYKQAYQNTALKPYLLKWLSKEAYRDYTIEADIKRFAENPTGIRQAIEYHLSKKKHSAWLDSIAGNSGLYSKYRDTVITEELATFKIARNPEGYIPPSQSLAWHTRIPYPESYTIIRQQWIEAHKPELARNNRFDNHFLALVKMGDPEARKLFDAHISKFIKTNGQSYFFGELNSILLQMNNSYAVAKMVELLKVTQKFQWMSDGDEPPMAFNCQMWINLMHDFEIYAIRTDPKLKITAPCENQLKLTKEINNAAQALIAKLKLNEMYWMQNMPFYKK